MRFLKESEAKFCEYIEVIKSKSSYKDSLLFLENLKRVYAKRRIEIDKEVKRFTSGEKEFLILAAIEKMREWGEKREIEINLKKGDFAASIKGKRAKDQIKNALESKILEMKFNYVDGNYFVSIKRNQLDALLEIKTKYLKGVTYAK